MTRIVNVGAYERPVFAIEGLGEWLLDQEKDVRRELAAQLLDREDGAFALADGEEDPRPALAAEAEAAAAPVPPGVPAEEARAEPAPPVEPPTPAAPARAAKPDAAPAPTQPASETPAPPENDQT